MISIQTDRIQLIPLDHSLLMIWKNEGRLALENALNLSSNPFTLEEFYEKEMEQALKEFWIPQTHKYPFDFCWYTNWEIIDKSSSCSVGGIGFSGLPNNEGTTEIGYAIDQKFRGKGFASEAVTLLINWASQAEYLKKIIAETPVDNKGSQKVLLKNQFVKTSEKTIFLDKDIPLYCWEKEIKK
jgi:RimJ/RimL family protein N-acetyltransferase